MPVSPLFQTRSPIDGVVIFSAAYAGDAQIQRTLDSAAAAQTLWAATAVDERAAVCRRAVDYFATHRDDLALEITRQMGRPIRFSGAELDGVQERGKHMIDIAALALADLRLPDRPGCRRFIRRCPLGVVLVLAPWNYPYLTAVNSIVPALMAGNAVILKHSSQTPLCAARFKAAFDQAGLPPGVLQTLFLDHEQTARMLLADDIRHVAFTGSVAGGRAIEQATSGRFIGVGLELGGKDPAYVRADADLAFSVAQLVDGAFFNSGQSCCGIERIYVDRALFADFLDAYVKKVQAYRLGNPLDRDTTLGPVVSSAAAGRIGAQITQAIAGGAKACIDTLPFEAVAKALGEQYLAPQVLIDVNHHMAVMTEETFGPVVGIMPVGSDEEAVRLMNDSAYGLTASIWSRDSERAEQLGDRLQTGTVFLNRCDYLDPALVWTGVKHSGRGCTLSRLGYDALTRPKSFLLNHAVTGAP